jgi:hypothetical protein
VSFAGLALAVAGAGVACLAVTAAAVALLPLPPYGRALVLLAGIAVTLAAMSVTSRRITDRAIRAEFGDETDGTVETDEPGDGTGGGPGAAEADGRGGRPDGLG